MSTMLDIDTLNLADISTLEGTLSQRIYISLRQAILTLDLAPGCSLQKSALCEKYGVSRAPISEAISRLSSDGLVDVVPQSGTHISYLSMDVIREGIFLRNALEMATITKVTQTRTEEQLKRLQRNYRLQQLLLEDDDSSGFYTADNDFHGMLMEFTGFPNLPAIAQNISLQVSRARMLCLPCPGRLSDTLDEHKAILDAIRAQDINAAQEAMSYHLNQLLPRLETLEQERPDLFHNNAAPLALHG